VIMERRERRVRKRGMLEREVKDGGEEARA
jgi:hypothetical protein